MKNYGDEASKVDNRCAPLSDNAGAHKSYIALVPSMNVYSSWSNIRLIHILHLILPQMRKELCGWRILRKMLRFSQLQGRDHNI